MCSEQKMNIFLQDFFFASQGIFTERIAEIVVFRKRRENNGEKWFGEMIGVV